MLVTEKGSVGDKKTKKTTLLVGGGVLNGKISGEGLVRDSVKGQSVGNATFVTNKGVILNEINIICMVAL